MRVVFLSAVALAGAFLLLVIPGAAAQFRLSHPPISIEGEMDLLLPGSGVTGGSGSEEDPYIIGPWSILAPDSAWPHPHESAIHISGVTSAIELRGIVVSDGWEFAIEADGVGPTSVVNLDPGEAIPLGIMRGQAFQLHDNEWLARPYSIALDAEGPILLGGNQFLIASIGSSWYSEQVKGTALEGLFPATSFEGTSITIVGMDLHVEASEETPTTAAMGIRSTSGPAQLRYVNVTSDAIGVTVDFTETYRSIRPVLLIDAWGDNDIRVQDYTHRGSLDGSIFAIAREGSVHADNWNIDGCLYGPDVHAGVAVRMSGITIRNCFDGLGIRKLGDTPSDGAFLENLVFDGVEFEGATILGFAKVTLDGLTAGGGDGSYDDVRIRDVGTVAFSGAEIERRVSIFGAGPVTVSNVRGSGYLSLEDAGETQVGDVVGEIGVFFRDTDAHVRASTLSSVGSDGGPLRLDDVETSTLHVVRASIEWNGGRLRDAPLDGIWLQESSLRIDGVEIEGVGRHAVRIIGPVGESSIGNSSFGAVGEDAIHVEALPGMDSSGTRLHVEGNAFAGIGGDAVRTSQGRTTLGFNTFEDIEGYAINASGDAMVVIEARQELGSGVRCMPPDAKNVEGSCISAVAASASTTTSGKGDQTGRQTSGPGVLASILALAVARRLARPLRISV